MRAKKLYFDSLKLLFRFELFLEAKNIMLCSKMTSFLSSEGVSEITFGSICSRSL